MPERRGLQDPSILCLSDYFGGDDARTAGAGAAALTSFEALRAAGADVHLLAGFSLPAAYQDDPRCTNLGGYDLRERGAAALTTAERLIWNADARRRVVGQLQRFDPARTVVILHQWTRFLSPATLHALGEYPVLVYLHDYFQVCPTGAYYNFQRREACELKPGGLACAFSHCDRDGMAHKAVRVARHAAKKLSDVHARAPRAYVHVSDASRAVAEPHLSGELHYTIYHPLEVRPAPPARDAPAAYDVGYFGRLEPEKGIQSLVAALQSGGWSSLFVGSGSLEGRIRQELPQATLLPWSPREEVQDLMSQCRVVVLPSIWRETWGSVTPEALACGVPVVVSSLAGSSELVAKYGGGRVFTPSDPNGLFVAMDRLLGDEVLRKGLGRQACSTPEKAGLGMQAHARRLLMCIETLHRANQARIGRRSAPVFRPDSADELAPRW